jgi:hypothetical protein
MVIAAADKDFADHKKRPGRQLLSWLLVLVFASAIYPARAHAQVIGELEVNISFQFHAGKAKLPAREYRVQVLDDSDLTVMEISSGDGSTSALFQVQAAQANSLPAKIQLIFNKYGNRYFLSKLFDDCSRSGREVVKSGYENRIAQEATEAQERVPAQHPIQPGNARLAADSYQSECD